MFLHILYLQHSTIQLDRVLLDEIFHELENLCRHHALHAKSHNSVYNKSYLWRFLYSQHMTSKSYTIFLTTQHDSSLWMHACICTRLHVLVSINSSPKFFLFFPAVTLQLNLWTLEAIIRNTPALSWMIGEFLKSRACHEERFPQPDIWLYHSYCNTVVPRLTITSLDEEIA